jgi:CRISPR-associated exonuclease Cas4
MSEAAASRRVTLVPFSDLARAAYCPRQLYYVRRDDERSVPPKARERIDLAFRYDELVDAPDRALRQLPLHRSPAAYRRNLERLREREEYEYLVDPASERGFLSGKDCHGTVHKVLEPTAGTGEEGDGDPEPSPMPIPTLVSSGEPPENGVWEPQAVRAVGIAKALAWEREQEIERALVEYPAVGVVREVRLTLRKKAAYRSALRAARSIDGPPPRVDDDRCDACDYAAECGTRRRSIRSLLG